VHRHHQQRRARFAAGIPAPLSARRHHAAEERRASNDRSGASRHDRHRQARGPSHDVRRSPDEGCAARDRPIAECVLSRHAWVVDDREGTGAAREHPAAGARDAVRPLEALFGALEAAGIGLDVESARDAVWLVTQLAGQGAAGVLNREAGTTTGSPAVAVPAGQTVTPQDATATAGQKPDPLASRTIADRAIAPSTQAAVTLSRVRLPLAAGLAGDRGVPGALRPLRRKV